MSFTQVIESTSTSNEHDDAIQLKHRTHSHLDINSIERSIKETDPLSLEHKKKSEKYIHDLKKKNGGHKLQNFYRNQNELIDNMLTALDPEDEEEKEKQLLKVTLLSILAKLEILTVDVTIS
jgi:hypothetical protein